MHSIMRTSSSTCTVETVHCRTHHDANITHTCLVIPTNTNAHTNTQTHTKKILTHTNTHTHKYTREHTEHGLLLPVE
jgi:hypothetical protein